MKYLFILGRNLKLSIAEVVSYFNKIGNNILNYQENKNAILIEIEKKLEKNVIDKFGGVISIGEIVSSGELNNIIKELDNKMLYSGRENKLNYCLWNFSTDSSVAEISSYLKKRFRAEKLKATEKKINGLMTLQEGIKVPVLSHGKLIHTEFFLFNVKDIEFFGKITEKCDYKKLEKRDMNKPVRREELSISPRLAKIMINLSMVKDREKLLDPFCGIGVILQEALIQKISVIGIDKDKEAIKGARKNLEWGEFEHRSVYPKTYPKGHKQNAGAKKNYELIQGDSTKISPGNINCIVTEPDFGKILKKIPSEKIAKEMIINFENLMNSILNNLDKKVSGRIVFSSPLIKTQKSRVSCDIKKILNKTKLKVVAGFPIQDFRENQVVGRLIFVLE